MHSKDSDCQGHINEDGFCEVCQVYHGEPCHVCGGRGYHQEGCPESDATIDFLYQLDKFLEAAYKLNESWEKLGGDFGTIKYPFKESFDETLLKMYEWKEATKQEFKDQKFDKQG